MKEMRDTLPGAYQGAAAKTGKAVPVSGCWVSGCWERMSLWLQSQQVR